jgi:hypothetical protein
MASGRLGSAQVAPFNAALLYSNTSGTPAAVSIQATALDTTNNEKISYAIDSATVSLNQLSVSTTISSGNVDYKLWWLDPINNTTPMQYTFVNQGQTSGGTSSWSNLYWDGSSWTYIGGRYGGYRAIKFDPYYYTNYAEYNNKSIPSFLCPINTSNSNTNTDVHYYNAKSFVGGGAAFAQAVANAYDTGTAKISSSPGSNGYTGPCGGDWDPYFDYYVGGSFSAYSTSIGIVNSVTGYNSYQVVSGGSSILYQAFGSNPPENYSMQWWGNRFLAQNGFCIVQPSGCSTSTWAICDVETWLSDSSGNVVYAFQNTSTPANSGVYAYSNMSNGVGVAVSWMEWNPNTNKFYIEFVGRSESIIYSATKASLRSQPNKGGPAVAYNTFPGVGWVKESVTPWGYSNHVQRPVRVGQSLWITQAGNGTVYSSTDLINWNVATTQLPTLGFPSGTTAVAGLTSTSFLYAGSGIANINKFLSNWTSVSQNALIENQTSFSNYQRSGLVLSAGDKLYVQNYGNVSFSITAMGYEG